MHVVWRVKGKISGSNGKFSCLFTHYPFFWSPWLHSILDALWNHVVIIWKHLDFKPGIRLNARLLHYVSTLEKVVYTPLVTRLLVTSLFFLHLVPTHCVKHGHYGRTYFFFLKSLTHVCFKISKNKIQAHKIFNQINTRDLCPKLATDKWPFTTISSIFWPSR